MRDTPLEASITQALGDATHDGDNIVSADVIELTGRTPLVGLDLGAPEA